MPPSRYSNSANEFKTLSRGLVSPLRLGGACTKGYKIIINVIIIIIYYFARKRRKGY